MTDSLQTPYSSDSITEVHPTDETKFQIASDTADWPLYKDPYLPILQF